MKLLDKILIWLGIRKKVQPGIKFGWKRDLPDHRDYKFKVSMPVDLPPMIDLRDQCPPVYDQGELGSCTAQALGGAYQFEEMKQQMENFVPSRLFIYYNEREMEGTVNEDSGAVIRDGLKTMVDKGVCDETLWPYKECKFKTKPSSDCYKTALDNQVLQYLRISPHNLYDVKQCLALGYPIVFGFTVFESMMTPEVASTGIVPVPKINEQPVGGHAVLAVGYDDSKRALIVRNSWGTRWGINGYFYLPYEFVNDQNMSADYWSIRLVE
jgi:C1A family cysteine protease